MLCQKAFKELKGIKKIFMYFPTKSCYLLAVCFFGTLFFGLFLGAFFSGVLRKSAIGSGKKRLT